METEIKMMVTPQEHDAIIKAQKRKDYISRIDRRDQIDRDYNTAFISENALVTERVKALHNFAELYYLFSNGAVYKSLFRARYNPESVDCAESVDKYIMFIEVDFDIEAPNLIFNYNHQLECKNGNIKDAIISLEEKENAYLAVRTPYAELAMTWKEHSGGMKYRLEI